MLRLPCPHCGLRDEPEFSFAGEPVIRPIPAAEISDAIWADYVYLRHNEKGPHRELWCHSGGCGHWFVLVRDTATHAVITP